MGLRADHQGRRVTDRLPGTDVRDAEREIVGGEKNHFAPRLRGSLQVGGTESHLGPEDPDGKPPGTRGEFLGDLPGVVGGSVLHDYDLDVVAVQFPHQLLQRLPQARTAVVGGHYDGQPRHDVTHPR